MSDENLQGLPKHLHHPEAIDLIVALGAATLRAERLVLVQKVLAALCFGSLAAVVAIKFGGGGNTYVKWLGITGGILGLGAVIAGTIAQRLYARAGELRRKLEQFKAPGGENVAHALSARIPLTIGFANLGGKDFEAIAAEDATALAPMFARSAVVANDQIPSVAVLFLYAKLGDDGTIAGTPASGISQIVQLAKPAVLVLASPNSSSSIQKAVALPGPKTANVVLTLDRNGAGFTRFFRELFDKMREGKEMLSAWAELAPQHPAANALHNPQTVLLAEAGKLVFPR
jgi:hypothetical protein